ncbi:hypothetical protein [Radicibacter daui]|uniref:hypothetical protein n=1 Tax=Radicibacter daui TaxID=3064829 RepID=UPI004046FF3F
MAATNLVLILGTVLLAGLFFRPRFLASRLWRATVTPLASIIGSGFLVAAPILAHSAGTLAWAAMAGLCAVAWLFGAAIRFNIRQVEPRLTSSPPRSMLVLERLSDVTLSLAYFVSVSYYLNLFAAFGLRLGALTDPFWIRIAATSIIAAVGIVGGMGGLKGLERLEVVAVGLKLSLIGALFAALALALLFSLKAGSFTWQAPVHVRGWHEASVLLGLVILVQGFETSRYLGAEYSAEERVRTMRWAQLGASAIYLVFILLVTPYFLGAGAPGGEETAILDMLAPLGAATGPLIIMAALASQLSAAVADMNGSGGLISESTRRKLPVRAGNVVTALAAIAITWSANIYEIITWASKMFVAYYALQSAQATLAAWRGGQRALAVLFAAAVLLGVIIVLFAVPAGA